MTEYQPRNWKPEDKAALAAIGIVEYDTWDTVVSKLDAIGFDASCNNAPQGFLATSPFFEVWIRDRNWESAELGHGFSKSDCVDAAASAIGRSLEVREEEEQREAERLASNEPEYFILLNMETAVPIDDSPREFELPPWAATQLYGAQLVIGNVVLARIGMPWTRGTHVWTEFAEETFRKAVRQCACHYDWKGQTGEKRIVFDPGQQNEIIEDLNCT